MVKNNKVILILFIVVISFVLIIIMNNDINAVEKKDGIENFPDSYKPYLKALQEKYPNWTFTALYTGLDWKYVVDNENKFGKNLVPKSYSDNWKNTTPGQYNVEVDSGWVDCSRQAVEYTMDPRNFLNYVRIFQFEGLSYNSKTNSISGIEKILYGTEFYNTIVKYLNSSGTTITTSSKYSDLILSAAKTSKVSSYHLASRIKQEVGPFLSHSSISGKVKGYEGLYNFYNIGATSSSEPMGAIKNGLQYAKDGKGASQTIKDKYLIPWNTKAKAITGGGIFIGSSYINAGQDTLYLQKFHVVDNSNDELFWHQYMTNVLAPYSESKSIYNGYVNTGLLSGNMNFIIPVYENMPEIPVKSPNILDSDFKSDSTRVYAKVSTSLNIRSGPATSYEILTNVPKNTVMTRIEKGKQSGELWDRVQLDNGMIGYVFQNYLEEYTGEEPELSFDNSLTITDNQITGWNYKEMTVSEIKSKIKTIYDVEIYDYKGKLLKSTQYAGTGATIKILDKNNIIYEYVIVLYGDVNGDGKINSIDLLVLQRHILQVQELAGAFWKSGNVRKNGKNPSSLDSLLIQRHILEIEIIKQ